MPFKRYQIASVWRDGPLKTGRYREFTQCDADIVGVDSLRADAECVALTQSVFDALGLKVKMRVNNRKFLDELLKKAGVAEEKWLSALLSIDKLEKIGKQGVEAELKGKDINGKIIELIEKAKKPSGEIAELLDYCKELGVRDDFVVFDASLARGLNYYTGTVFECYLSDSKIKSSVCGGGRYDDLIAKFSGRKENIPAVGISFGVDVIGEAVEAKRKTVVQAFVIPIKTTAKAIAIAQELRAMGVNCSVDLMERSISKNLDYASKQGIPFAVLVGELELKQGKVKLRNLESGEEKLVSVGEAAEAIGGRS
jgi:histidyl-tRNA synthetase